MDHVVNLQWYVSSICINTVLVTLWLLSRKLHQTSQRINKYQPTRNAMCVMALTVTSFKSEYSKTPHSENTGLLHQFITNFIRDDI